MSLYSLETVSGHFDTEAVASIWVILIFACDFFFLSVRQSRFVSKQFQEKVGSHFIQHPDICVQIGVPLPFDLPRYELSSSICLLMVSEWAVFNVSRRARSDVNGVLHNYQAI